MSGFPIFRCGLLVGVILSVASAGPARGQQDDDDRLAKQLLTAAEKYSEAQDAKARYGQRAEIALTILQGQEMRNDLNAQIRNMNAAMSSFPQNHRLWTAEQWAYHDQKVVYDQQLTALDHRLETLRLEERRMFEQELQQAQAEKRRVRPLDREAMLNELQRVERERDEAVVELKEGIEAAARKKHITPRQVLDGAVARLNSLKTSNSPDVERDFLSRFKKYAGGDAWLDKGKAPAVKPKKDATRTKKDATRTKKDATRTKKANGF
jgi:hypothetical protein